MTPTTSTGQTGPRPPLPTTTRAVVVPAYGGPEGYEVRDVPLSPPGPGQVLLEVRAAGANPADWKRAAGVFGTDPADLPLRLGHEAAGVVLATGPGVEDVHVGDEVIAYPAPGAYAAHVVVAADDVFARPSTLSWDEAAGLMLVGVTAVHAATAVRIGADDVVLVHGAAGGVGSVLTQVAVARGATVIGTCSAVNDDAVAARGALPVRYGPGLLARVQAALIELGCDRVDAAVDTVGDEEALRSSVALVADRSRVATIAAFGDLAVELGVQRLGGGPGADPGHDVRARARAELADAAAQSRLHTTVWLSYRLEEVAEAHRASAAGHARGRIVLVP